MSDRRGDWVQVYTGGKMYPLDPRKEEIDIESIGHSLANLCRYVGHCRDYFSVAQHSVIVSYIGPQNRSGLWWLLHDAPEAYIGDISRPLKRDLYCGTGGAFRTVGAVEAEIMDVIAEALNLPPEPDWSFIKFADDKALATEARDLMSPIHPEWMKWIAGITPLEERIVPLPPREAKALFLRRYEELNSLPLT